MKNEKSNYEVTVGNIGSVYLGDSLEEAMAVYKEYKTQSDDGYGRAGHEEVTFWKDSYSRNFSDFDRCLEPVDEPEFPSANLVKAVVDSEKQQKRDYRKSQFDKIKTSFKSFSHKVKFLQAGETKWLDITNEEFEAIEKFLAPDLNVYEGDAWKIARIARPNKEEKLESENFEMDAGGLFQELNAEEEKQFRTDARKIYVAGDEIPSVWHPVYRDECKKINDEMETSGFRK